MLVYSIRSITAFVFFLLTTSILTYGQQIKISLFRDLSPKIKNTFENRAKNEMAKSKQIIQMRFMLLDNETLSSQIIQPEMRGKQAARIMLNLFPDISKIMITETVQQLSETRTSWIGNIADQPESRAVFILRNNGSLVGNIRFQGRLFQIRPTEVNGVHSISEIDPNQFPNELPPIEKKEDSTREKGLSEEQIEFIDIDSTAKEFVIPDSSLRLDSIKQNLSLIEPPSIDLTLKPPIKAIPPISKFPYTDYCGPIIDVMVLYTGNAKAASADIEGEILLVITETNDSYANSGIYQRLRLVHSAEVSYIENGDFDTYLDDLTNPHDGRIDIAHDLRDVYCADLVSLWVEKGDNYCGIGHIMKDVNTSFSSSGFSVVKRECATGNFSFAHELGHNMAARHDRYVDDTDNSPYSYNHGFVNVADRWRTIMAYNDKCDCSDEVDPCPDDSARSTSGSPNCARLQYWSNPNKTYGGDRMGVSSTLSNAADNRKTLNSSAATVASFRVPIYDSGGEGWGSTNYATSIAFGDVDGDGIDEIGVARKAGGNARYWIMGLEVEFSGGEGWGSAYYATSIAFGDVDGDGRDEVGITRKAGSNGRYWILDDANNGFAQLLSGGETWGSGNYATSIAFGNVDTDSNLEVGITRYATGNARFWILDDASTGFAVLHAGGSNWGSGNFATRIAFGDVDGDGIDEVGVTRKASGNARYWVLDDATNGFRILLSGGDNWGSANYATSISFGDVDGDGLDEVGITRKASGNPRYWIRDDAVAGFRQMDAGGSNWGSGNYATSIAFADFDNDGRDEVAIGRKASGNARYWLLNDANCNFRVLQEGGAGWGSGNYVTSVSFGDVDGDGLPELGVTRTAGGNPRYWIFDISR